MADRKVEIEMSIKDNITKQLKSISDSFKKLTRDVQNSCNTIKNSLGNINVRLNVNGVNSQISNINRQINQLDKDVEVNVKAKVDSSELSNLSTDNIQDNVGESSIDIGDMVSVAGMGNITSAMSTMSNAMMANFPGMNESVIKINNALDSIRNTVSLLSPGLQQMYSGAIVNSDRYQNSVNSLNTIFNDLQEKIHLIQSASMGEINLFDSNLTTKISSSASSLKSFNNEVMSSASASSVLDTMIQQFNRLADKVKQIQDMNLSDIDKQIELGNIAMPNLETIRKQIDTALSQNKGFQLKVTPEIQNLADIRNEIDRFMGQYENETMHLNMKLQHADKVKQQINAVQAEIRKLESTNIGNTNNASIDKLKEKLNQLQKEYKETVIDAKNIQKAINGSASAIEKSTQKFDRLGREIAETTANTGKLKTAMSGLKSILTKIGSLIGIYQLFNFLKDAVNVASSLQEVQNVVDTVFGNMSQTIEDFANNTAKNFGLTQLQAKKFSGTFGSILGSLGIHGENLTKMSTNLSKLAGDLASFNNLNIEDAFNKIRSGIAGEVEPLSNWRVA